MTSEIATEPSDITLPIKVSPDHHFLTESDGRPFFWLADTAWELFHRLNREETEIYFKDRSKKGFNVIQAVATGKLDYEGLKSPNRDGVAPFVDANPMHPNDRYFEHIDWVIDCAARYRLRIAMLPVWGALFVNDGPASVFDITNAKEYGRWIGHRYRGKGVIWVLGGDTNPIASKYSGTYQGEISRFNSVVDFRPIYDAMADGIMAGDGGDPFITYHPTASSPVGAAIPRMSLYFGDRDWFDMSMLQSSHMKIGPGDEQGGSYMGGGFIWNGTFNYLPIFAEYNASPPRPIIDGEPCYEDHPIITNVENTDNGFWRSHDVRHAAYQALFAGAAGHTYGNFTVWDLYDPGNRIQDPTIGAFDKMFARYVRTPWQQALHAPGATQMQYAKALMLSRPYFSRVPDQTLIVGKTGEGDRHIGATRDRDGAYAMIYLPQGQPVTLDLSRIAGSRAVAWWYDPRTGVAKWMNCSAPTGVDASFTPPSHGEDQDWVLVLDSEGSHFAPPGTTL